MQAWGITDPGMIRKENQDAYQIVRLAEDCLLAMVCDGMGGARSGNIASEMAVDVFSEEVRRSWKRTMTREKIEQMLRDAAALANQAVYEQSISEEEYNGMGTTLVAVVWFGAHAHIINVGDSRLYHADDSGITCVTTDHSFVQLMVQRGEISLEQAKSHPGKNLITRAIGTEPQVEADLFYCEVASEDSLLLCSDGLSNVMADQEILFELAHVEGKENCCQRLLEIARSRGAPDNVTAVVLCN